MSSFRTSAAESAAGYRPGIGRCVPASLPAATAAEHLGLLLLLIGP